MLHSLDILFVVEGNNVVPGLTIASYLHQDVILVLYLPETAQGLRLREVRVYLVNYSEQ